MRFLILGGTAWLGGQVTSTALGLGHQVTCLARGSSGDAPDAAMFIHADRDRPKAYDGVAGERWDVVIDVSRQPGQVRSAVTALADRAGFFVFVSSTNVYADHSRPGQDEDGALLPALDGDVMESMQTYGQAKVACEQHVLRSFGPDRALIARVGLIGGPGDVFDRSGYWPLRFSHPATEDGAVLVPDAPDLPTQVIDVRDLAAWLVNAGSRSIGGIFITTGETVPLAGHLDVARTVGGHTGPVVPADQQWLLDQGVQEWMASARYPCGLPTLTPSGSTPTTAAKHDAPGSPPGPWTKPWPTPSRGRCPDNATVYAEPAYPMRTSDPCSRRSGAADASPDGAPASTALDSSPVVPHDGSASGRGSGNISRVHVLLRPAVPADAAFLTEMLVEAAFWRPDGPHGSVDDVSRQPELAHYVAGWPRPTDRGVVAEAGHPVGAAWLRLFTASHPGYGFVNVATPEVSMGVVREWRGRGIGARLLDALITAAREAELTALSLSVEPDNYARRLYERVGFRQIGQVGGSITMLLRL